MTFTGTIKDSAGLPIANATYQAIDFDPASNTFQRLGLKYVAVDSTYQINDTVADSIYYLWEAPGYVNHYANTTLLSQAPNIVMIKDASGMNILPVAGAGLALLLLASKKKNKVAAVGKLETKDVIPYIVIGGALMVTGVLKKILTSIGILDSADTKALDQTATDPGSFWNINYWRQFSTYTYSLTAQEALDKATAINNSFGVFNDDEDTVKGIFRSLQTKAEVSYLAFIFQNAYGQDLLSFLRGGNWPQDRLSDADVEQINNFLSNLPTN